MGPWVLGSLGGRRTEESFDTLLQMHEAKSGGCVRSASIVRCVVPVSPFGRLAVFRLWSLYFFVFFSFFFS